MDRRVRWGRLALGLALVAGPLTACAGSDVTTDPGADPSRPGTAPAPTPVAPTVVAPGAIAEEDDTLSCGEPSEYLLDWAGVSLTAHPGPIVGAVVVFAATTDTGDWYVLGIDRLHETDAGVATSGEGTRSLALTNVVTAAAEPKAIPLWQGALGQTAAPSWDNVIWTGETRAAGERAAARTLECLDGAAG